MPGSLAPRVSRQFAQNTPRSLTPRPLAQKERMTIDRTLADEHHPGLYLRRNLADAVAGLFDEPLLTGTGNASTSERGPSRKDTATLQRRLERELLYSKGGKRGREDDFYEASSQKDDLDSLY